MGHTVIEDVEDRVDTRVIRRKIIRTDDPQYPSGYRYALHYGYTNGRGTILRYDNENETVGRHECHTPEGVTEIEFPGMLALRDRFLEEIDTHS
ncbi:hypothetical protein Halru_2171 [Halovivax ruber XH-70]|uniref:Uncharacterized protein n=1 Tax=Halovivax ruber (strain DSM 18193 / JCM 13892 / XH-70) TaxID=797302 RepID=L0IDB5_HALRX|nr:DUF6516 family protein [Halovivax ruber]AGB16759.1 hypothetical protein Halru_2171 [Halovivax ruber XH-70]